MLPAGHRYAVGEVVRLRKVHPCGSDRWLVTRTGMDFVLKCMGCGRRVMLTRVKFERAVRAVLGPCPAGEDPA